MEFRKGNNYLWICLLTLVLCVPAVMIAPIIGVQYAKYVIFVMPIILSGIVFAELRSGIALDQSWTAAYEKGHSDYNGAIRTHILSIVMLFIISIIGVTAFE